MLITKKNYLPENTVCENSFFKPKKVVWTSVLNTEYLVINF